MPQTGSAGSAVLNIDLARLFPGQAQTTAADSAATMLALRGGAVRLGIDTEAPGCAAIAISIWDETRTIPLDHLVRFLRVGTSAVCVQDVHEQQTASTLFSDIPQGIMPDVSLHVFEFKLNGNTHSASFMVFKDPSQCDSYKWDSDATLTDLICVFLHVSTWRCSGSKFL